MLNRRILRIKAFKVLYSSVLAGDVSLATAESRLDLSCEATRDLYVFMLGIVSPLTRTARERIETARCKFNPTEEEKNPNMKFAENALAGLLDNDPDFRKAFEKRKFSWEQYDLLLKKTYASILTKDYFKSYMESGKSSLQEDCRLFVRIFEEEFVESVELEHILEDMSIYWNDDLAYALTYCCRSLDSIARTGRWTMPPLYQSDMKRDVPGVESDKMFVHKLLQNAFGGYGKYLSMVSDAVSNWDQERIVSTDMAIIVCGLAEAENFPAIPVKVTINEYVEISKYYGTPKSRIFVNGLLDRIIQKLVNEGKINKR
ncbi:MAG: hypothetical protein NC115_07900 [Bacteroidales bacterium]|nr:hypothetical protein [Bacteroides sp.]MCM1198396.1 hypothetical protein [Clostridium sp.]MCM1502569.1 hypothetical protein [Bacteroidales bacterium]